ncbi:MAG: ATP-binding protein, partial [Muribaculaceae bacterium]|nr:ATP-binding protein [Muribaculaceae bacterium]
DAMDGSGRVDVSVGSNPLCRFIEVADTGKGISRKNFKTVFNPGYTTKSRGWGLGLTLAKRIIEEYHNGRIFVKQSEPGKGTTFRIELPAGNSCIPQHF